MNKMITNTVAQSICLLLLWSLVKGTELNHFSITDIECSEGNFTVSIICNVPKPQNMIVILKNGTEITRCTTYRAEPYLHCTISSLNDLITSSTVVNNSMTFQIDSADTDILIGKWVCQNGGPNDRSWSLSFPNITCPPQSHCAPKSNCADDGSQFVPTLDAEVVKNKHSTLLKFKCTLFKRPVDSLLHFLVNRKSVVVMYFANETCFTKRIECNTDTCDCSYKDYSFTWFYPVNSSSIGSEFGVITKIGSEKTNEFIKLTLSGIYSKRGFKVNPPSCDEVHSPKETDIKITKPKDECENLNPQSNILTGTIAAGVWLLIIINVSCLVKRRCKSKSESRKQFYGIYECR